jgi:WD40 repeat protein
VRFSPSGRLGLALVLLAGAARADADEPKSPPAPPVAADALGDPLPPHAVARLGTLRLRHQHWISGAAFTRDGKTLASSGHDHAVRIWDAQTGKEQASIPFTDYRTPRAFGFSPSGKLLAGTADVNKANLFLWDATTGKQVHALAGHKGEVLAATFADDETLASVGRDGYVRWWDTATGKQLRQWDALAGRFRPGPDSKAKPKGLFSAKLSRDGDLLVASLSESENEGIFVVTRPVGLVAWNLAKGEELWSLGTKGIDFGQFGLSADGKALTLLADQFDVSIRDGWTGKEKRLIEDKTPRATRNVPASVVVSPDGALVAVTGQGPAGMRVFDAATGEERYRLNREVVHGIRSFPIEPFFSPDGKLLAWPLENSLVLWDAQAGKERLHLDGHRQPVHHLYFSADGKSLLTGTKGPWPEWCYPREAIRWDTAAWKERERSDLGSGGGFHFVSPDHRLRVEHDDDRDEFTVYERNPHKALCKLEVKTGGVHCHGGFFSPGGKLVAQPLEKELAILDATTGKKLVALPENAREVWFAFSPDDRWLAYYDTAALIHVVRTKTGEESCVLGKKVAGRFDYLNPRPTLAFSTDGNLLASWDGGSNTVFIWDLKTGKESQRIGLPGRVSGSDRGVCLAFSPDGKTLAAGCVEGDNDVRLYGVAAGKEHGRLGGHKGRVRALAFSPDGEWLASGSDDTTVLVWDVKAVTKNRP